MPQLPMRLCHKCSPVLRSSPLHRKYAAAFSFAALLQDDRQRKKSAGVKGLRGQCRHRGMRTAHRELCSCGRSVPQHDEIQERRFSRQPVGDGFEKQGKDKEATELFRQVADRFAMSERAEDRFETVRALLALSGSPESVERSRAFGMLETLLEDDPDHPEYRFQYAQLLAGNPRLFRERRIPGIEPNAAVLLLQLADAHPERPEYGLALVELMLKKLRYARNFREHNQRELADTVNLSERLLGRWPNDPQVISGMVRLHARYIGALRREGKMPGPEGKATACRASWKFFLQSRDFRCRERKPDPPPASTFETVTA